MNFLIEILTAFFMGVLSFFLVKYFISKFSVKQTTPILTE
jgi:hypothetical protein